MNGVLIAIVLALLVILGIGYTVSRMGAAEKSRIFDAKKHGECSGRDDDRDWFV